MTVLATIPSKTNPNKGYDIMQSKQGHAYCTCPGWKYQNVPPAQRSCKHLATYHAMNLAAKEEMSPKSESGAGLATSKAKVAAAKTAKSLAKAMKAGGAEAVEAAKAVLANPKAAKTQQTLALAVLAAQ